MDIRHRTRVILGCLLGIVAPIGSVAGEPPQQFTDCPDCPTMIVVPPGSVRIGSHEMTVDRKQGERPYQLARINQPFALSSTEVTVGQYRRFVRSSGHVAVEAVRDGVTLIGCNYYDGKAYGHVAQHNWQQPGYPQRENDPVVCVSWSDAHAYVQWLTELTGRVYRVPSTVEFEYASRGGTETVWFWGNESTLACNYANVADQTFARHFPQRPSFACDDGFLFTTAVASFAPNPFGLYDTIGNAWEWTNDCWHDNLTNSPLDGVSWQTDDNGDCTIRVPKGGGWISGVGWSRTAMRAKDNQHYRSSMLGFRVAAALQKFQATISERPESAGRFAIDADRSILDCHPDRQS